MLKNKLYMGILIGLLFGICITMPLKGAGNSIVGMNHWTHDMDNNFLVPTNTSVDVSLNNNSLVYADLSDFAGDNISWDAGDMEFDVAADGTSKWNLVGGVLYPKVSTNDIQVNGTLYTTDNITMEGNRKINATINLTIGNPGDIILGDDVERDMYPNTTLCMNLGRSDRLFNDLFLGGYANFSGDEVNIASGTNFTWYGATPGLADSWIGFRMETDWAFDFPVITGSWGGVISAFGLQPAIYLVAEGANNPIVRGYSEDGTAWADMLLYNPTTDVVGFANAASKAIHYVDSEFNADVNVVGNTQLNDTLTVGVDDTGHDVTFHGATAGKYFLWDESENRAHIDGNLYVEAGYLGVNSVPATDKRIYATHYTAATSGAQTDLYFAFTANPAAASTCNYRAVTGSLTYHSNANDMSGYITVLRASPFLTRGGNVNGRMSIIDMGPSGLYTGSTGDIADLFYIYGEAPVTDGTGTITDASYIYLEDMGTDAQVTNPYEIMLAGGGEIFFRDGAIHIGSLTDGHLDLTADTSIDLNADVNITDDLTCSSNVNISSGNILGLADDSHVELIAREKSGGPPTPIDKPGELRFIRNGSLGNYEVKGFIWYDGRTFSSVDGLIFNSSENIQLIANKGSSSIILDGKPNLVDDRCFRFGDGWGNEGDYGIEYDSATGELQFNPSVLTGSLHNAYHFNAIAGFGAGNTPNFIVGSENDLDAFTMNTTNQHIDWNGTLNVSGVTNSTGGFATDTGTGWSGTYTVTEGIVTVRQGIIIDVDWD